MEGSELHQEEPFLIWKNLNVDFQKHMLKCPNIPTVQLKVLQFSFKATNVPENSNILGNISSFER